MNKLKVVSEGENRRSLAAMRNSLIELRVLIDESLSPNAWDRIQCLQKLQPIIRSTHFNY